jgi:hypothetical protein
MSTPEDSPKPTRLELISMMDELITSYERLPPHAMMMPITNYDMVSSLLLISQIFKSEKD